MTPEEHLEVLDQRRRYLDARVAAKKSVGWEYVWDQRERDSLAWAVSMLGQAMAPVEVTEGCQHPEDKRVPSHNMGEEPEFWCQECKSFVKGVA